MSHLDIVDKTPDRLVMRRIIDRGEWVVAGIIVAATLGFIGYFAYLVVISGDLWLGGATLVFGPVMLGMAFLPNRVKIDRLSDRVSMSMPLRWRWVRRQTFRLTVQTRPVADLFIGELHLGPYVLARTPPQPSQAQAQALLVEDAALVGSYLE